MSEVQDSFENNVTKAGWLLMRSKYRKTWKKRWLVLESSNLSYSKTQQGPFKQIPLYETIIEEANLSEIKHVFRLKPLKSRHEYLFQASSDDEEHSWMQSICFAKKVVFFRDAQLPLKHTVCTYTVRYTTFGHGTISFIFGMLTAFTVEWSTNLFRTTGWSTTLQESTYRSDSQNENQKQFQGVRERNVPSVS